MADIGRNDLCPCGSGKKYKRCHGAPDRRAEEAGEGGVQASLRIHTTPAGKEIPVLGWAPQSEEAWDTVMTELKLAEQHGLLLPMENADHWEAVGVEIRLRQTVPGLPQWSLTTVPKPQGIPGLEKPIPAFVAQQGGSLWHREWQIALPLSELVKWVDAFQTWKSVIIAPYDTETAEFLPFGFQIWVPGSNVVIEPAG
jgi:hypothetical protein